MDNSRNSHEIHHQFSASFFMFIMTIYGVINLHITRGGELAEILTEKLADNSRNSCGRPGGILIAF